MTNLDPPARHPRMITAKVWPHVADGWRWDVQHPGPPAQRVSGDAATESEALAEAAAELSLLARRLAG